MQVRAKWTSGGKKQWSISALLLWEYEIIFRCWECFPVPGFPQFWIAIIAHKARKALGGVSTLILQDKKLGDTNISGERTEPCPALVAAVCVRNWNEQWGKRETRGLPKGDVYSCTLTSGWKVPQGTLVELVKEQEWGLRAEQSWGLCFTPGTQQDKCHFHVHLKGVWGPALCYRVGVCMVPEGCSACELLQCSAAGVVALLVAPP